MTKSLGEKVLSAIRAQLLLTYTQNMCSSSVDAMEALVQALVNVSVQTRNPGSDTEEIKELLIRYVEAVYDETLALDVQYKKAKNRG